MGRINADASTAPQLNRSVSNMVKQKTAAELLKELESDPEYKRKKKSQANIIKRLNVELSKDEKQLVSELNKSLKQINCHVDSVWDLVNSVNSYQVVYPILNKHLDLEHHKRIREGIIRALTIKDVGENIKENFLRHFKRETDPDLKWVISNALKTIMSPKEMAKYPYLLEAYNGMNNTEQKH